MAPFELIVLGDGGSLPPSDPTPSVVPSSESVVANDTCFRSNEIGGGKLIRERNSKTSAPTSGAETSVKDVDGAAFVIEVEVVVSYVGLMAAGRPLAMVTECSDCCKTFGENSDADMTIVFSCTNVGACNDGTVVAEVGSGRIPLSRPPRM